MLNESVIAPAGARPSVEAPLHALLGKVVIHSHPPAVNALTCHRRSKELLESLWRKDEEQPLWVPYADPGVMLAFRVRELIDGYRRRYGALPRVILLQNHGLICSAESATDALQLHASVIDKIESAFSKKDATQADPVAQMVARVVGEAAGAAMQARRFAFPQQPLDRARAFGHLLRRDHARPRGVLRPEGLRGGRARERTPAPHGRRGFRRDHKTVPRVIVARRERDMGRGRERKEDRRVTRALRLRRRLIAPGRRRPAAARPARGGVHLELGSRTLPGQNDREHSPRKTRRRRTPSRRWSRGSSERPPARRCRRADSHSPSRPLICARTRPFSPARSRPITWYSAAQACVVKEPANAAELREAVEAFRRDYKVVPRIIMLGAKGIWVAGQNEKKIAAAQELLRPPSRHRSWPQENLQPLGRARSSSS